MLESTFSCTWMLLATATDSQLLSCRDSELANSICSLTWRQVKETSQKFLTQGQHLSCHNKYRNVGVNPRVLVKVKWPYCPISAGFRQVSLMGNYLYKLVLDSIFCASMDTGNWHLEVQMHVRMKESQEDGVMANAYF